MDVGGAGLHLEQSGNLPIRDDGHSPAQSGKNLHPILLLGHRRQSHRRVFGDAISDCITTSATEVWTLRLIWIVDSMGCLCSEPFPYAPTSSLASLLKRPSQQIGPQRNFHLSATSIAVRFTLLQHHKGHPLFSGNLSFAFACNRARWMPHCLLPDDDTIH